jgi:hypothetical protein
MMKAGLIDGDRLLPLLLPLHAIANRYVAALLFYGLEMQMQGPQS